MSAIGRVEVVPRTPPDLLEQIIMWFIPPESAPGEVIDFLPTLLIIMLVMTLLIWRLKR